MRLRCPFPGRAIGFRYPYSRGTMVPWYTIDPITTETTTSNYYLGLQDNTFKPPSDWLTNALTLFDGLRAPPS